MAGVIPQPFPIGTDLDIEDKLTLSNSTDDEGELIIFGGEGNAKCVDIANAGTGDCMIITQTGILGASSKSLFITSSKNNSGSLLKVFQDNPSSNVVVEFESDGTGDILKLNADGNAITLNIDTEATSADAINIEAVNTSGSVIDLNLSPGSSSSASALKIVGNSNANGTLFSMNGAGTGRIIQVDADGIVASGKPIIDMFSTVAQTNTEFLKIHLDHSSSSVQCIKLVNDGTGSAQLIDMNGATGNALEIDQDSNDNADIYAIKLVSDNAGAGAPGGVDMSSFAVDEPLFKFVDDAVTTAGTLTKQAAVDVAGTIYYIHLYTTGS